MSAGRPSRWKRPASAGELTLPGLRIIPQGPPSAAAVPGEILHADMKRFVSSYRAAPLVVAVLTAASMALGSAPRPCACGGNRIARETAADGPDPCCSRLPVVQLATACCTSAAMEDEPLRACCFSSSDRSGVRDRSLPTADGSSSAMPPVYLAAPSVEPPDPLLGGVISADELAAGKPSLQSLYCIWRN